MIHAAAYTPGEFTGAGLIRATQELPSRIPGVPWVRFKFPGFVFSETRIGGPRFSIQPETGIGVTAGGGPAISRSGAAGAPTGLASTATRVGMSRQLAISGHVSHFAGQPGPESGTPSYHQSTPARCR